MIVTDGKSLQTVIDEIAGVLIAQGERCMSANASQCMYGNKKGQHCAIGWLLPEGREDLMRTRGNIYDMIGYNGDLGPNDQFIRDNEDTLHLVQLIHDRSVDDVNLDEWEVYEHDANELNINIDSLRPFFFKGCVNV